LMEYVRSLLTDSRTLEVWGLIGAKLARVECVADETQSLELDSGDWILVRVSGLPTTDSLSTTLNGIVRFRSARVVGKDVEQSSGQRSEADG
jgi:hypothetical protein